MLARPGQTFMLARPGQTFMLARPDQTAGPNGLIF